MLIFLAIIYATTQVTRQLIQPKLVGDSMGLNPIYTLFLLYAGYKMGGIIAMIFAVPAGLIVLNLYKAGAFDYILNDVWILAEGIMSLRETGQSQKKNK
jgi:predicted PurR-regulated permease PerM